MSKSHLQEIAKKNPPTGIKVGDYIEIQGTKVRELFNAKDIIAIMKQTMNILYVSKIGKGMVTVTPRRGKSSPAVQVPTKYIRYKLTNVEQE